MITKENWREHLILDSKGEGLKKSSQQNTLLFLRFDGQRFGTFALEDGEITVEGGNWNDSPEKRKFSEADLTSLVGCLEYYGLKSNRMLVKRSVECIVELGERK